jgi:hypothetical protein
MKFEIKSRFTGNVIFSLETEKLKLCVEAAIKSRADLSGADLSRADLSRANLSGADLSGANLSGADLFRADLSGADLSRADLSRADLHGANLSGANLSGANLSGADLSRANLSGADLSRANLSGANLSGANLSGANLSGANLSGANLSGARNAELQLSETLIVPEYGGFIGWKKLEDGLIVKLLIPEDAKRLNAYHSRKCRASKAIVLDITKNGDAVNIGKSKHDNNFIYEIGAEVIPDSFDDDRRNECSAGIHFFITKIEAESY